jgi:putative tryptophan/tyrosine transport system substrate-binding protein
MRRRDVIAIIAGSVIAWPIVAAAQAPPMPVIGFFGFSATDPKLLAKFQQGLGEWGYFEDRNVAFKYWWAHEQNQKLPTLAAEVARRKVALIVTTGGLSAAKAARGATATIPILFTTLLDPVKNGFLTSFDHPGGNVTGLTFLNAEFSLSKRLELLRQLVPRANKVAYLFNNDDTGLGPKDKAQIENFELVANKLGLLVEDARNRADIETAFTAMAEKQIDALLVGSDPFFSHERALIAELAARYALPAGYPRREFAEVGGLMSYGPSATEAWRQLGEYAGRILKGARPQELPVRLHDQYELVINMQTAKALGLNVPALLHGLADDVIE